MAWSVMTHKKLLLLFLDWKQAFDSLDHTAILEALRRFGLSDRMIRSITGFYESPTFEVQRFDHTATGKVSAGIRQGCPLSPYLFITVLTVTFSDLDSELDHNGTPRNTWSEGYPHMILSMLTTHCLCLGPHRKCKLSLVPWRQ